MADVDPRLVALYDRDNPDGPDHDFYRAVADELAARSIVDIGCGTGILTVTFARPERTVVGIDPSASMLAFAAARPGADGVQWIPGDSRAIPNITFDYAVMTGNVAQHIPDDDWPRTLSDIASALRTGGVLAFESRNPAVRAWEGWPGEPTWRPTAHGLLREWMDVEELEPGQVQLAAYNVFEHTGEDVIEQQILVFRGRELLETQLAAAGLVVDGVWGDWHRSPWTSSSPLMVFEARRP